MSRLRSLLRQAAFSTGALSLARVGARHALTVAMFHRVVDPADPDYCYADPVYTISVPLFDELLGFFQEHYNVVDMDHVLAAADGDRPLPDNALLITFDDGWADNLRFAAPLLLARGMPAVVFVAACPVQSDAPTWWQEEVFALARDGGLGEWLARDGNRTRIPGAAANGSPERGLDIVTHLALMDRCERDVVLRTLPRNPSHARMMLTEGELRQLAEFNIAVAPHGSRHVPLTSLADIAGELADARDTLARLTDGAASMVAMSCPHGRYDARVIAAAQEVGIRLFFTSDRLLNATDQGMLPKMRPLGRIDIIAAHIESAPHRLDRSAAARWLWSHKCI